MRSNKNREPVANWQDEYSAKPDLPELNTKTPNKNHILCRTKTKSTAVYGNNTWDFNPYNTSNIDATPMYFNNIFDTKGKYENKLIGETKMIIYHLYYHTDIGITGRPSVNTLLHYWHTIRKVARFCKYLTTYSAVGNISIEEFVGNPRYVAMFIKENSDFRDTTKTFPSLMNHLQNLSPYLKWHIVTPAQYAMTRIENDQHPVIPPRIYLKLFTLLSTQTTHIRKHAKKLASFIEECQDPAFARNSQNQFKKGFRKSQHKISLVEAIEKHDLSDLFTGDFELPSGADIRNVQALIHLMQYVLYHMILFTTGMRDQELLRAKCSCINIKNIPSKEPNTISDKQSSERFITLISSTTKQEGYEAEVSWIATEETLEAVEAASILAKAIAKLYKIKGDPYLFISATKITMIDNDPKIQRMNASVTTDRAAIKSIKIEERDLELLRHTDPGRDFDSEEKFSVGQPWPLTSHQHRRSLAYYAYSSSLVSEPVLMQQFKHRNIMITRYYGRSFEQLTTIFGFYDPVSKTHILPKSHIALEYQTAMPMAVAEEIIQALLLDTKLSGGTGTFLEKQKAKLAAGTIDIRDIREDTIRRAHEGFISFRKTLVGGCTQVEPCDLPMLGDYISCTQCESSIIIEERKPEIIEDRIIEMNNYKPEDAEYQLACADIELLKK